MKKILIIDDDIHIGNLIEEALSKEGYRAFRAYSGTEALLFLAQTRPDLILLDLMLPGLSGEEVLPRIKGIPVIVISAKADVDNKVQMLFGGAVDYITKPFQIKELLARIAVQFRSIESVSSASVLEYDGITLDTAARIASIGKDEIKLTRTEYAILKLLMQNQNQIVTKSQLLDRIGPDTPDCTESSLKMHISNLRRKLRDADGKDHIEAIWGIGFRLR